jgi:YVTN family beta-propeller protein
MRFQPTYPNINRIPGAKIGNEIMLIFIILFLNACAGSGEATSKRGGETSDKALVTIYMEPGTFCPAMISFTIEKIDLLDGERPVSLDTEPVQVDLDKVKNHQVLLGLAVVPPGSYTAVRLRLTQIRVGRDAAQEEMDDREMDLSLPVPVPLERGDSTCFFVGCDLTEELTDGRGFMPRFFVRGQVEPLAGELVYVDCDDIDTIYLVSTDRNFIVGSIGLIGRLGEIRIDDNRRRLYVISSKARSIYVLDIANHRFVDRIALPMSLEPQFMALSDDGNFAFITDTPTNQVHKINLITGVVERQTTVGYRPKRIIFFKNGGIEELAVSSPGSKEVIILNADSLNTVNTASVGFEPEGLLFLNSLIYASDRRGAAVTMHNLRNGKTEGRISVGLDPTFLMADPGGVKIYVSNHGEDSLSVLTPGQHTALRKIFGGDSPFTMALSNRRRIMYVGNRDTKTITAIDLNTEKILAIVPLGGTPFSIDTLE